MGFLDIGIKKTSRTASARASLAALKRRRRLRYFSQIDRLPPVFGLIFRRNTYTSSEINFTRHLIEFMMKMFSYEWEFFHFFQLRLRLRHLRSAYELVKTRLTESEAEAEG